MLQDERANTKIQYHCKYRCRCEHLAIESQIPPRIQMRQWIVLRTTAESRSATSETHEVENIQYSKCPRSFETNLFVIRSGLAAKILAAKKTWHRFHYSPRESTATTSLQRGMVNPNIRRRCASFHEGFPHHIRPSAPPERHCPLLRSRRSRHPPRRLPERR